MATTRPHFAPFVAVGALSAATAIALTRVFGHAAWLAPVMVAAIAPVVIAWFAIRYRWSARAYVLAVFYGAVWWSAVVCYPDRTVLRVVPTPAGLGVWLRGLFDAPHVLRSAIVPVPPVGHALQLAIVALWVAAAGAAWSAAKHGSVLVTLLPDFALFIAIASLGKGPYVVTTMLWAAAAAAFLLVQHSDSVLRARTGFQAPSAHRSRLVSGGAIAAAMAVAFGAFIGPRLPEADSAPLLNYRGLGHGGQNTQIVDISPLVGIGDKLRQPTPTQLFTVTSSKQARWRLMALDNFDGAYWGLPETTTTAKIPAEDGPPLAGVLREPVVQRYAIGPMGGKFLPAAYRAFEAPALKNLVVIPESVTFVVPDESHAGLRYGVTSALIGAPPETLRLAPPVNTGDPDIAQNLQLPVSLSDRVRAEAQRVVGDASTEYDKARRLQDYFRDPNRFTYDQDVDLSESSDAMVTFLFDLRRGFCEQFAGTYAAMARAVGLPARVAVGFQPGTVTSEATNVDSTSTATYAVTTRDAHAWPEVYFPNVGWVAFEPTPGRYDYDSPGDPNGTRANAPPYRPGEGGGPGASTTTAGPTTTVAASPGGTPSKKLPRIEVTPSGQRASSGRDSSSRVALWLIVPAIFVLALFVAGLTVVTVQRVRRWRRVHASSTRERVGGAWTQATEELARSDIRRRPAATLVEFALREAPAAGAGSAGPPLLELAQLQTQAMYAVEEPSEADADRAWECANRVGAALRAQTTRRERFRRMFGLTNVRGSWRRSTLRTT